MTYKGILMIAHREQSEKMNPTVYSLVQTIINSKINSFKNGKITIEKLTGMRCTHFRSRVEEGYTTFHKALNKLINAKLVDIYVENRGKNGRTRVITVKQPMQC
jgi:hypothetical protein